MNDKNIIPGTATVLEMVCFHNNKHLKKGSKYIVYKTKKGWVTYNGKNLCLIITDFLVNKKFCDFIVLEKECEE